MKKYEFTGEEKNGLKQIRRLSDGVIGGWIEKESNLSHSGTCWVSGNARVYDNARVSDNAWVSGDARVEQKYQCMNITNFKYNITLTPTWGRVGCVEFNPMEMDEIPYNKEVSLEEFYTIKEILKHSYELMLFKMRNK